MAPSSVGTHPIGNSRRPPWLLMFIAVLTLSTTVLYTLFALHPELRQALVDRQSNSYRPSLLSAYVSSREDVDVLSETKNSSASSLTTAEGPSDVVGAGSRSKVSRQQSPTKRVAKETMPTKPRRMTKPPPSSTARGARQSYSANNIARRQGVPSDVKRMVSDKCKAACSQPVSAGGSTVGVRVSQRRSSRTGSSFMFVRGMPVAVLGGGGDGDCKQLSDSSSSTAPCTTQRTSSNEKDVKSLHYLIGSVAVCAGPYDSSAKEELSQMTTLFNSFYADAAEPWLRDASLMHDIASDAFEVRAASPVAKLHVEAKLLGIVYDDTTACGVEVSAAEAVVLDVGTYRIDTTWLFDDYRHVTLAVEEEDAVRSAWTARWRPQYDKKSYSWFYKYSSPHCWMKPVPYIGRSAADDFFLRYSAPGSAKKAGAVFGFFANEGGSSAAFLHGKDDDTSTDNPERYVVVRFEATADTHRFLGSRQPCVQQDYAAWMNARDGVDVRGRWVRVVGGTCRAPFCVGDPTIIVDHDKHPRWKGAAKRWREQHGRHGRNRTSSDDATFILQPPRTSVEDLSAFWVYAPHTCYIRIFTSSELWGCLSGRTTMFVGDSTSSDTVRNYVQILLDSKTSPPSNRWANPWEVAVEETTTGAPRYVNVLQHRAGSMDGDDEEHIKPKARGLEFFEVSGYTGRIRSWLRGRQANVHGSRGQPRNTRQRRFGTREAGKGNSGKKATGGGRGEDFPTPSFVMLTSGPHDTRQKQHSLLRYGKQLCTMKRVIGSEVAMQRALGRSGPFFVWRDNTNGAGIGYRCAAIENPYHYKLMNRVSRLALMSEQQSTTSSASWCNKYSPPARGTASGDSGMSQIPIAYFPAFDITTPFHWNYTYGDGIHYGRPKDYKPYKFTYDITVDLVVANAMVGTVCDEKKTKKQQEDR